MTIREDAIGGKNTELFKVCAATENMDIDVLMAGVARGTIAITKDVHHDWMTNSGQTHCFNFGELLQGAKPCRMWEQL